MTFEKLRSLRKKYIQIFSARINSLYFFEFKKYKELLPIVISDAVDDAIAKFFIENGGIDASKIEDHIYSKILDSLHAEDQYRKNEERYRDGGPDSKKFFYESQYTDDFLKTLGAEAEQVAFLRRQKMQCKDIALRLDKTLMNVLQVCHNNKKSFEKYKIKRKAKEKFEITKYMCNKLKKLHRSTYKLLIDIMQRRLNGDSYLSISEDLNILNSRLYQYVQLIVLAIPSSKFFMITKYRSKKK